MGELRDIPATHLDKYIEDQLLPDTHFRVQVNQAIDIMSSFLKERCFQRAAHSVRVLKVVKGGSSGKGTSLRGRSDADLVFLSPLTSFQEQLQHQGKFIREIRRQLEACQREERFDVVFEVQNPRWEKPRALSFMLRSPRIQVSKRGWSLTSCLPLMSWECWPRRVLDYLLQGLPTALEEQAFPHDKQSAP